MGKKKKYPDNIVYNYETEEFDANKKEYPTDLSAPVFNKTELEPIKKDSAKRANTYFMARVAELKKEYIKLIEEYNWTKLCYESDCGFDPILNHTYHLYEKEDKSIFLSLIAPDEWGQPRTFAIPKYVGTFRQTTLGKWDKIDYEQEKNL